MIIIIIMIIIIQSINSLIGFEPPIPIHSLLLLQPVFTMFREVTRTRPEAGWEGGETVGGCGGAIAGWEGGPPQKKMIIIIQSIH